jgi:hypothetical protein
MYEHAMESKQRMLSQQAGRGEQVAERNAA